MLFSLLLEGLASLRERSSVPSGAPESLPYMALGWLVEAAEPLQALSRSFLCAVHIRQLQRDNLYTVSVPSKTTNAARTKPSSAWSAHRTVVHAIACLCSEPPA